jgi:hypothetical protein
MIDRVYISRQLELARPGVSGFNLYKKDQVNLSMYFTSDMPQRHFDHLELEMVQRYLAFLQGCPMSPPSELL